MAPLIAVALRCGVVLHADMLDAIVRIESRGNPNALALNGDVELVRQPKDREEAVAMARWLAARGYNFDAGLGQVNSANLGWLGLDVASVFEPCANLQAASRVLEECYGRARQRWPDEKHAMTAALSCYNTGHFTRGVRNGYVAAVRASAASSLAPSSIPANDSVERKPGWRRDDQKTTGRRSRATGQGTDGARGQDEAFTVAMADIFDASPRGERAP